MNEIPFPYKFSKRGVLKDGLVFHIPQCCQLNHDGNKCRMFYADLSDNPGVYTCPFGFAVGVEYINDKRIYFCGLNVLKVSDRRLLRKYLKDNDFTPRLSKEHYHSIIDKLQRAELNQEIRNTKIDLQANEDEFLDKKILIEDTIHELRKLNGEFKIQCEELIYMVDDIHNERIHQQAVKAFSTSQLMSIRLDTYDFGMNPINLLNKTKQPMSIHKKTTKAAKALFSKATANNVFVRWDGESFCEYMATDVVELLPYILIENGIKYSLPKRDLTIHFEESGNVLQVTITSYSLRPSEQEMNKLTERGYRGVNAGYLKQGKGIGLYLANVICEYHDIGMEFRLGQERYAYQNYIYSDFIVTLTFHDIIKQ